MTERVNKKVVLVGDPGCGKTSLLVVFLRNKINVEVDETKVALSLTSTAGE